MKKIVFLLVSALSYTCLSAQTLFTYGSGTVDKAEFLRAYNKNKTPVTDKERSLRDYLDLYIRFKLKVKAAKDLKLDTLPQLRSDLESFRGQIEESYMNNEPAVNRLVDEAFDRSQKDLHLFHFFIPVDSAMKPGDTLKAYLAAQEIPSQLRSSNNNVAQVAGNLTAKYVLVKGNDLGFITVFSLPYAYENLAYGLRTGEISKPYRTSKGWHVFYLAGERKSAGRWRIAQILFSFPPGEPNANTEALKRRADSVHDLIAHGEDFAKLAGYYSDDKMTYMTGGEMPEFGTGKYDPSFEKEVFSLMKDGDISHAFASPFGYHIIKRIKQIPTPSDKNDDGFLADLKQKVLQDNRVNIAKAVFYQEVTEKVGLKKLNTVKEADLFRYADTISAYLQEPVNKKIPIYDKALLNIGTKTYKGSDWLRFVRDYKSAAELYKGESNAALYEKFISTSVLDYYRKNLEFYNPEFRYQMDEFRDGNVLFEIMERNVWSSAGNDSVGLMKHYEQNKAKYTWSASANIIVFNCTNKTIAEEAVDDIKKGKDWKNLLEEQNNAVQADSGRYEIAQTPWTREWNPQKD